MVYERIASLLPESTITWLNHELEYIGLDIGAQKLAGFVMLFGLALSTAVAINLYIFLGFPIAPSFLLVFALFSGGTLFWINSIAEGKGRFVEKILPDALQLIASNIKSGLTTERAMFVSARSEFGPLSVELKNASKMIVSGERIGTALMNIPKKIKSKVLERTLWLISEGIKSGGQISGLLIQLSIDLREENALQEEIKASIGMYIMLIFFSAAFGAPMLFGISSYIVGVLSEQTAELNITPEQMLEYSAKNPVLGLIGISKSAITEDFVVLFSMVALFTTCIFASLTLGVITNGKETRGVKYIPLMLAIAFALFFIVRILVQQAFGTISL